MMHGSTGGQAWLAAVAVAMCLATVGASASDFPCLCQNVSLAAGLERINITGAQQTRFTVGVLAIRGKEAAYKEHNKTWNEYLNCEVQCRFRPAIQFEMLPLDFSTLFTSIPTRQVDFVYVNPSAYSCIESEWGASSLASQKTRTVVDGTAYETSQFGGIIFTKKERADINTITDLKGKSVAAASISGLGSGQAQFLSMMRKGLSFINDPAQLVFTSNQGKVVKQVESGNVDVGFVRTNQLEKMAGAVNATIKFGDFKIIDTVAAQSEGKDYPFPITTDLYPEWNIAALTHVDAQVQQEVQAAMLRLKYPHPAAKAANILHWRTTMSYMQMRNLNTDLAWIERNPSTGTHQCIRSDSLWASIRCPPGHFKMARDVVEGACSKAGRKCAELDTGQKPGDKPFQCVCQPCKKAFEVEVVPVIQEGSGAGQQTPQAAGNASCSKMSVCGETEQGRAVTFHVIDNRARTPDVFKLRYGVRDFSAEKSKVELLSGTHLPDISPYTYGINVTVSQVGLALLEIYADGQQISESPLFVRVNKRDCADSLRDADANGVCRCVQSTAELGKTCVRLTLLVPLIVVPVLLLVALAIYAYVQYVVAKRDSVWKVRRSELEFDDPVEVLGRGTFGMVLKAEYRGTTVAVKRVIPSSASKNRELIFDGAGDDAQNDDGEGAIDAQRASDMREIQQRAKARLKGDSSMAGTRSRSLSRAGNNSYNQSSKASSHRKSSLLPQWLQGDDNKRLRQDFIEEMRTLSKLRHPCITTVMGAVVDKSSEPMMVMELMDYGSLYDLLHNDSMAIEGEIILPILKDIAQGLRFLHSADPLIVHGDLKSPNVLVDAKFRAKVADFGLSQKKHLGISTRRGEDGPSGTPFWMAPELLAGSPNTTMSDVFAFGIVLFEVYSRQEPYFGEDPDSVLIEVQRANKRPFVPGSMPKTVVQLMEDCWHKSAENRPPFDEIERRLRALTPSSCEPLMLSTKSMSSFDSNKTVNSMLYDVFPRHVADALKAGQRVEPERREVVTIFFSDIVGFTTISSELDPVKVSTMLHRLYSAFDQLADTYGIFKVETIGDAYMAVTNLVEDQHADHAIRIARFAVGAIKAARDTLIDLDDPSRGHVRIRVGLHAGPVVANVVGTRNLRYCLFGDTVNTASRMESNSEEFKIHVSERAVSILREQMQRASGNDRPLTVKKRGIIPIKGKGDMLTFWVSEFDSQSNTPLGSTRSISELRGSQRKISQGSAKLMSGLLAAAGSRTSLDGGILANVPDRLELEIEDSECPGGAERFRVNLDEISEEAGGNVTHMV